MRYINSEVFGYKMQEGKLSPAGAGQGTPMLFLGNPIRGNWVFNYMRLLQEYHH